MRAIAVSTVDLSDNGRGFRYSLGGRLPPDLCCGPGVEARLLQPPQRLFDVDLDAPDIVVTVRYPKPEFTLHPTP